jgi:hypothetical protein
MPKKLERCVSKVEKKGQDKSSAYAICNASINKGKKKNPKKGKK